MMRPYIMRTMTKAVAAAVVLMMLQACSPVSVSPTVSVADAYETSGIVAIQPYTRTIFSSTNF